MNTGDQQRLSFSSLSRSNEKILNYGHISIGVLLLAITVSFYCKNMHMMLIHAILNTYVHVTQCSFQIVLGTFFNHEKNEWFYYFSNGIAVVVYIITGVVGHLASLMHKHSERIRYFCTTLISFLCNKIPHTIYVS